MSSLSEYLKEGEIFILSKSYCHYCTKVKNYLKRERYPFKSVNVDHDEIDMNVVREAQKLTDVFTFPIIFIGTKNVKGCTNFFNLLQSGELQKIMENQKIQSKL